MVRRRNRSAFTLLEVLMVIVILGVLAALIVPNFVNTEKRAKIDATRTQIQGMTTSIEAFRMHCGRLPTTEEGLTVLFSKPSAEDIVAKWSGPYLQKPAIDAWGKPLNYRQPGQYNAESYDIWSSGPNGTDGDDDDIRNWETT